MIESKDQWLESQKEETVLGVYFEETNDRVQEPNGLPKSSNLRNKERRHDRPRIVRNADPMERIRPHVEYETKVPNDSTIIANISCRRVDRITPEQATRTDACLPCGSDTSEHPDLMLYRLPCRHMWCRACLARAFRFALHNQVFGRLQCCTNKNIPLSYFERIAEDRLHPLLQYEPQTDTTTMDIKADEQQTLPGLRDWNPVKVTAYVEKDQEPFISTGDILSYKVALEEHKCLPKDRVYCYGTACNMYIPMTFRTKTQGQCLYCDRKTCLRCRKNPKYHTRINGICTADKKRLIDVENDTKMMSLARRKGWKNCPRCGVFVQKIRGGCSSVVCRCGLLFYYG